MSAYTRTFVVNLGTAHSGLSGSLGYKIESADGLTIHIAQTATGVAELSPGSGSYAVSASVNTDWGFAVIFWSGPAGVYAADAVDFANVSFKGGAPGGTGTLQGSFDPSLSTPRDSVRSRIGDVSPPWMIDDRTIDAHLAKYTFTEACAVCCEEIGAQAIQMAEQVQQRNMKLVYTGRSQRFFELANRIRQQAAPDPTEPAQPGALSAVMAGPDLTDYLAMTGLPIGDPNGGY